MLWSNEALAYENKWYKAVKSVLMDLAKETATKFEQLQVDENGVLIETPRQDMFFDKNEAVNKMVQATEELTKQTLQYFGDRALKGIDNAL